LKSQVVTTHHRIAQHITGTCLGQYTS
jgi:hypothetical protein